METGLVYLNAYFVINKFKGVPKIMEPQKNAELKWVSLNELPVDLIDDRKTALQNMKEKTPYLEIGWEK